MENKRYGRSVSSFSSAVFCIFSDRAYPLFIGALVLLGHTLGAEVPVVVTVLLLTSLSLLTLRSIRPTLAMLILIPYVISREHGPGVPLFSDYLFTSYRPYLLSFCALVLAIALAIYTVRMRLISSAILRGLPLFRSLTLLSVALLLGGLFFSGHTYRDTLFGFFLACSFFIPYVFIFLSLRASSDRETDSYLAYLSWVSLAVITAEVILLYVTDDAPSKEEILFGWGTWTHAGSAIAVRIPLLILGFLKGRAKGGYLFLTALSLISIPLTASRGAMLVGLLSLFLSLLIVIEDKRIRFTLIVSVTVGVLLTVFLFSIGFIDPSLLDGNGRLRIWREGLKYFRSSPIFGIGYYSADFGTFTALHGMPDMAHNTVIQLLSSTGIFGVIAYAVYRFSTVRTVLTAPTRERLLLALSAFSLLFGSLFDNFLFYVTPLFHYSALLAVLALHGEKTNTDA